MKKTNIIIISLCLSVFILISVVHADVIFPGTPSKNTDNLTRNTVDLSKHTNTSSNNMKIFHKYKGGFSNDTDAASKNELNSLLIICAAIIGIIAQIAWLVIRKIKK